MTIRPALAAAAVLAVCLLHVYVWPGGGEVAINHRPAVYTLYQWGPPPPERTIAP